MVQCLTRVAVLTTLAAVLAVSAAAQGNVLFGRGGLSNKLAAAAQAERDGNGHGAAGGVFQMEGALEVVSHDAVTVLASDGTLFEAWLGPNAAATAAGFAAADQVGDDVTLEAVFINPLYVTADSQFFNLRLLRLTRQRAGSGRELARALASPAWREAGNRLPPPSTPPAATPPPPAAPADPFLEAARTAVLHYAAELPNFLVTETLTRRIRGGGNSGTDHIQSELAVAGGREYRSAIVLNGRPWPHPFAQLSGLNWNSDFAERLLPIVSPACGAVLHREGAQKLQGAAVEVYSFRLRPSLCAGSMRVGPARAFPSLVGKLDIDTTNHLVRRLEESYQRLPESFEESSSRDTTDWGEVLVAGVAQLLPKTSVLEVRLRDGSTYDVSARYANYRRFETSSHMTVVGPAPPPATK